MEVREWEREEWKLIHQRRERAFQTQSREPAELEAENPKRPEKLIGLTLSGGGIRSALYNDGFLQGLSHRGFLRFVDYLASVSGGGYIAGHLFAQAENKKVADNVSPKEPSPCFHDDSPPISAGKTQRWHLGRNPLTGEVDRSRLAGVGGYLSRPLEILPAYLWACFFSLAFYLGACGILATLTALFWRSFDDPNFRIVFAEFLGIRFGDELLIAFIPTILLFGLCVVTEICVSILRWTFGMSNLRMQRFHTSLRALFFVMLALATLTSIAIFLGNGTTNAYANASGSLYLNHYAQWLAVIAGTLQILVFFGSDHLFRSERQEAKQWQRGLQKIISVGVTFFLVFAMIHWMGRENISEFTDHRDPYLMRGDVTDWEALDDVFSSFSKSNKQQPETTDPSLNIADHIPEGIRDKSSWVQTLYSRRWGRISQISSIGQEPIQENATRNILPYSSNSTTATLQFTSNSTTVSIQSAANSTAVSPKNQGNSTVVFLPDYITTKSTNHSWFLEERLLGAVYAYQMLLINPSNDSGDASTFTRFQDFELKSNESVKSWPVQKTIKRFVDWLSKLNNERDKRLREWNKSLQDPELTRKLIAGMLSPQSGTKDEQTNATKFDISLNKDIVSFIESKFVEVTANERKAVSTALRRIATIDRIESLNVTESTRTAYATVNRILLERLFPSAIRRKDIASTMVVPPYDQEARRSWLGFWLLLATVGALGGVFRHQVATVFQFYRRQLGSNFLARAIAPTELKATDRKPGDIPIYQLTPTSDGLPYPLMLAAAMEPVLVNGSYTIASKTFMFTPKYCGHLDDDKNRIRSEQVALSRNSGVSAVTLADAVTLSGAAVSPLMTTNRCLSMLVDIFNTGLGMQLYRTEKCGENQDRSGNLGYLIAIAASAAFSLLIYWISEYQFGFLILAFVFSLIIGICLVGEKGVPYFLKQLIAPKEVGPSATGSTKDYSKKSFYVADGGFTDYLGVTALLQRRCELIVISDAGANVGDDHLGTLAKMCESVSADMGIRFLDLDHEAPIDFGRLAFDERRLVHQPYLCMRVRYPEGREGLVIYCQMAISESDPIEIQHIRKRFPKFPDEPTVNQFYTDDQVSAYRALGYHIASRMCRELERWCKPSDAVADRELSSEGQPHGKSKSDSRKKTVADFSDALMNQSLSNLKGSAESVPNFQVLRERLLTAYRLACYEEVSYRKEDIFSEAVWPMAEYAFPNFKSHAESLPVDACALDCAESWLRMYEMSGDVRSAYRKAVLEDVNVLESEVQSYCASIYFLLAELNAVPLTTPSLLAAHIAVMAVACQEVHRGRPHSAFQIGGRRKLLEMCSNIADSIVLTLTKSSADDDALLQQKLGNIIGELLELERSVFQGSEHVTTISLAQCVSVMWGRLARGETKRKEDWGPIANRAKSAFESSSGTSTESRMLKARQELDRGLKRVDLERVANTLARLWYLGYFNTEAGEVLDDRHFQGFNFLGFRDIDASIANIDDARELPRIWLRKLDENKELRRAYTDAIRMDSGEIIRGIDSRIYELWRDLLLVVKSKNDEKIFPELLTAHLAATAISCVRLDAIDSDVAFKEQGRPRLFSLCRSIGEIAVKFQDKSAKNDDWNPECEQKLLRELQRMGTLVFEKSTPKVIGRFARSIMHIFTGIIRNERAFEGLSFFVTGTPTDAFEAYEDFDKNPLKQPDESAEEAKDQTIEKKLGVVFQSRRSDSSEILNWLWYTTLIGKHEMENEDDPNTLTKEDLVSKK